MTQIAVIGPGAVGSTVLAHLNATARHALIACVRTSFSRLEVETPDGSTLVATPDIATSPAGLKPVDWAMVTTKTYDHAGAVTWLEALVGPATRVAILQNGVEHIERFSPHVPLERLVRVVVECPAERTAPGRVRQRGPGWMLVPDSVAGRAFAGLFQDSGLDVRTTGDWITAAWRKLCLNAAGVVSALTLQPAGIVHDDAIADVMRGLVREVIEIGRREGAQLDDSLVEAILEQCRRAPRDAVNSILADRMGGRRMEIEARNGVVVRLGRRHHIATPFNEMAVAILHAAERSNASKA